MSILDTALKFKMMFYFACIIFWIALTVCFYCGMKLSFKLSLAIDDVTFDHNKETLLHKQFALVWLIFWLIYPIVSIVLLYTPVMQFFEMIFSPEIWKLEYQWMLRSNHAKFD